LQRFRDFSSEHLRSLPEEPRLAQVGSYLYHLPAGLADPGNLRLIHPGWWLGTLKKDRFEPAHALALGLKKENARRVAALSMAEAGQVLAYLRGEIPSGQALEEPESGWALVTVDGYPLGWGKQVQGRLKNYYPRGLRVP
jgi:NOL1/NOP2/fmu family ribosome biogenesis protein